MEDLSTVTISKSVGSKSEAYGMTSHTAPMTIEAQDITEPNVIADVIAVKKMLNRVYAFEVPFTLDGNCTLDLVNAIKQMQIESGFARPDGVVTPGKSTIRKLKALATPATLNEISNHNARTGVYKISHNWKTTLPGNYKLYISIGPLEPRFEVGKKIPVGQMENLMDITNQKRTDVLNKHNDKDFLKLIENKNLWGKPAKCRLVLLRTKYLVWMSNELSFNCVVQPFSGTLSPANIGAGDKGPDFVYVGTGSAPFIGRYLYKIDKKHYFKYGRHLMTDNQFRGFDCISFVGSLYEIAPETGGDNPYANSQNMADTLGATGVDWEHAKDKTIKLTEGSGNGKAVKKYFESTNSSDTYLLWKGSHITIVVNKVVHEFSASKGGYKSSELKDWVADGTNYHLFKLPGDKKF